MRIPKGLVVALSVAGLIGVAWAAERGEAPVDAVAPDNDRLVQLERRIAALEDRLDAVERRQSVPAPVTANWVAPAPAPQPLPQTNELETNGVKFRLYLLGSEQPATPKPVRDAALEMGGVRIVR